MGWQTVRLTVQSREAQAVEALLTLAGAESVSLLDASDTPQLEPPPRETPLWPNVGVQALFNEGIDVRALARLLGAQFPGARIELGTLSEQDWRGALQQRFAPRRIGNLEVIGADAAANVDPHVHSVRLNLGFAFGTGEHPTTRLVLEWLDAERPIGSDVLDYGCGSGVLALAALALGAAHAFAVDNDDQALVAARANAALNGAGGRLWIGAPEDLPERSFDLVLANILAGTLEALAPSIAARTVAGGRIVLSGILDSQIAAVQRAYAPYFDGFRAAASEGWARLDARRTADAG